MYIVLVWDIRDIDSQEPASELANSDSLGEAQQEIREYLSGIHGRYIYRWEITKDDKTVDFWE